MTTIEINHRLARQRIVSRLGRRDSVGVIGTEHRCRKRLTHTYIDLTTLDLQTLATLDSIGVELLLRE